MAGIFVKEHAKAVALFNDVTVITFLDRAGECENSNNVSISTEDGIITIRIYGKAFGIPKFNYFVHVMNILRYFKKLIRNGYRPDIIHAHVYTAGLPGVILGKIYDMPVIITEHWSGFPRRLLTMEKKWIARFCMNRAGVILPVSENLQKHIQNYGIKNDFKIVPNVVDTTLFYPLETAKQHDRTKKILLVALLSPVKGIPFLFKALSEVGKCRQDFVLDIIGDGPNRAEYEQMAIDLGVGHLVKFHGRKAKKDVATFMRLCDFFVLPSVWENLPCVLIEAMSSGVPVVATDVGGVRELVSPKAGLVISPQDVGALVKALEHMLDHYKDYKPENIAEWACAKFSYETVGEQLDSIYRALLAGKTGKGNKKS